VTLPASEPVTSSPATTGTTDQGARAGSGGTGVELPCSCDAQLEGDVLAQACGS